MNDRGVADQLHLRPCKHQVAGHLFEEGKAGSLVDDEGHFFKPLQVGPRGRREREFYERIHAELSSEQQCTSSCSEAPDSEQQPAASSSGRSSSGSIDVRGQPFSKRNATLLHAIPKYIGVVEMQGTILVELEDVAKGYRHPSIVDIKVGFRTWYPGAEARYVERCKLKDAATTQAALGFKICGMQVYRHCQRGYWRASKRWCKQLPQDTVNKALLRFANNEAGLSPQDVYGGSAGAIEQLKQLEAWFQVQRDFMFYSSSVLIIYEGDAETAQEANVSIRLVDFAHTFSSQGSKDTNFIAGVRAVIKALSNVMRLDYHDCLF